MEVIVWNSGEKFEKTKKKQKPLVNDKDEIIHNVPTRGEYNIRKKDIDNENKRDEIMERQMLIQTSQNPFFNKSFSDVLSDQEKFLIPQNSLINKDN